MKQWEQMHASVAALSLRERVIVFVAALLVIFGLWHLLWFNGATSRSEALKTQIDTTEQANAELETQIERFKTLVSGGVSQSKRRQLERAQQELKKADQRLGDLSQGLIAVDKLTEALQALLVQTGSLQLVSLNTEAATAYDPSIQSDEQATTVYRHTVNVTVRGRYFEVMDYLIRLESLSQRFYWQSMTYRVDDYPSAEVTLRLFTLSTAEGRFGV